MPTNKQRRDANRVRLQRQLEARRESEARRRKIMLGASIGATVVLIAAIVIVIVAVAGGDDNKTSAGGPVDCTKPYSGKAVTFEGVTVTNPTQLGCKPKTTSKGTTDPTKIQVKDLVVGSGKAASPSSQVQVQYVGQLYKKGTQFDTSWGGAQPASFSLQRVVAGFTQGIGGTTGVAPMKVGGRRIMILPSELGYGKSGNQGIPPNTSLVFVVDLIGVS